MIYIDSNVFIYAVLNTEFIGNEARSILSQVQKGQIKASTSALTFDELIWIIKKERSRNDSLLAGEAFLNMSGLKLVEVNTNVLAGAIAIMKKYSLDPRDSIHAASAIIEKAEVMISEDKDFDKIREIKRRSIVSYRES
ncbi:MAG: type II toxin-antitoxin system VapC family toxin [Thermoplasmataceae archaeon]